MKIGMVGLGRMGSPMARHMRSAGHSVTGFDIAPSARERASESGLTVVDTLNHLGDVEVLCSSLPATREVVEVYDELLDVLPSGAVCADLSTIDVEASRALATRAAQRSVHFLDTPVSGTSIHAESGTLVVMAGGDAAALEVARPVLESFSSRVDRVGPNGSGLLLKLITNRLLTTHLAAIAEAVIDMESVGLDVGKGLELIRFGAVPKLLDYKATPLMDRDFTPTFTIDLMRKDLRLAASALPKARLGGLAREILEEAGAAGLGDADLAALIAVLGKEAL